MSRPAGLETASAPYDFVEFERRADQRRAGRRRRQVLLRSSWAASLAAVGLLIWLGTRGMPYATGMQGSAGAFPVAAGPLEAEAPASPPLPAPTVVVRVDARLNAMALEDHIALVDHLLSDARVHGDPLLEMQRLERERARLVDSLVMIRRAESLMVEAR